MFVFMNLSMKYYIRNITYFFNSTFFLPSKFENQANRFAAYLILKGYTNDIEDLTVESIHNMTGIPLEYSMLIL